MRVVGWGDAIEIGAEPSYNMCAGRSEKLYINKYTRLSIQGSLPQRIDT